ncbi:hypothetical protein, partial [Beijerinckia sp. L45]|uniref:hypothetical protein n=1 Tax=Beijerinckia sp. L45 TaxID=1641855 RepID=UPI00131C4089
LQSFDAALVPGRDIPALWAQDVSNVAGIAVGWIYSGLVFAAPVAVPPTQTQLAASLTAAARASSNSITNQIAATETHLAGYQSAANMVRAANGVPSADPDKTAFANLATAIGLPATTLAGVVLAMDATSVGNLAILMTLEAAAAAATTAAQLATALSTFEVAIAAEVAALNKAGLTTTIVVPAAIIIADINA